jgi:hypothetical protein
MFFLIIMVIVIVVLLLVLLKYNDQNVMIEGISSEKSTQGSPVGSTTKKAYAGTFDGTFNGRMATDDQYFYDKLFDDVVYYPNTYEEDSNLNNVVNTGWVKCKAECQGNCVEYGIGGTAFCFN